MNTFFSNTLFPAVPHRFPSLIENLRKIPSLQNSITVSGNPCDNHNFSLKKNAFTTCSLFLCTNRD